MDKMIEGYRRFLTRSWPARQALFQDLAEHGQNPRAMVIACADSRVDPGMIFDAAPGEIFTVRNVANLVPPYAPDGTQHATSAALEFGVRVLRVADLVTAALGDRRVVLKPSWSRPCRSRRWPAPTLR
jgi:carbonic anhydrase